MQSPHWYAPFREHFSALVEKFLLRKAFQKCKKKVSEREVKSGGVAQLYGSKEPFQLSTRSNSGGSIWMPSQVRFQRKKNKRLKSAAEMAGRCIWAMSWRVLWQALGGFSLSGLCFILSWTTCSDLCTRWCNYKAIGACVQHGNRLSRGWKRRGGGRRSSGN